MPQVTGIHAAPLPEYYVVDLAAADYVLPEEGHPDLQGHPMQFYRKILRLLIHILTLNRVGSSHRHYLELNFFPVIQEDVDFAVLADEFVLYALLHEDD